MKTMNRLILGLLLAVAALIGVPATARSQQPPPENQQPAPIDPIRELNLSPEQRERIRAIREEMRDQRAAINQRLRETNRALEDVLDSDSPNDALVEKHLRDVADAQAASLRMRIQTERKVRSVLTSEQLATLRTLRQNARDARREQQIENNERRRERLERRGMPSRNTMAPLPRRMDPTRRP